jgi:hypothetical protein
MSISTAFLFLSGEDLTTTTGSEGFGGSERLPMFVLTNANRCLQSHQDRQRGRAGGGG